MSVAEAATNVEVLASLEKAVASANEHVSRAESIRKIKVLTTDFTEANGQVLIRGTFLEGLTLAIRN